MKKFIIFAVVAICLSTISCKRKIEEKVEDLIVTVMTDGEWEVSKYMEGSLDKTSTFLGWTCKFNSNRTCQARKGTTVVNGMWDGSTSNYTITGNFPVGSDPLDQMNGTWRVKKSNFTTGEFEQIKAGVLHQMVLTKK
jgi:hypothetical protein